jgi:hypothetical protein
MAAISALRCWSGHVHEDFPIVHQQRQADSGKGQRHLRVSGSLVVRWSKNLNVMFIIFVVFVLLEKMWIFPKKIRYYLGFRVREHNYN